MCKLIQGDEFYHENYDSEIESMQEYNGKMYKLISTSKRQSYFLYEIQGKLGKTVAHFNCKVGTILALGSDYKGNLVIYSDFKDGEPTNTMKFPINV